MAQNIQTKPTYAKASAGKKPTTMAELLATHASNLVSLTRGQVVEGTITKVTSSEILLDIGSKTEAVIIEKDKNLLHSLLAAIKVGDSVQATVISTESEFGYPLVSLRRFIDEKVWDKATKLVADKKPIEVTINESTKGGFLVSGEGISGFLPNSHVIAGGDHQEMVGKKITAAVYEVNRELKKIIFSQKSTLTVADFESSAKNLKAGDVTSAVIMNIAPFGIFLRLPSATEIPLEGFIHQSEVSWEGKPDLASEFKSAQDVEVKVIGLDLTNKRVNLSIKKLTPDPFAEAMKEYSVDKRIKARIINVSSSGITLDLGDGVEGIIKKEKVPPNSSFEAGQEISATVVEVDSSRHKVILVPVLLEKPMGYR